MKRVLLVVGGILYFVCASAQQDPQFTQNMFNRLSVNPGFAGSNGSICATLLSREQWMGFEGNPQTNLFSADMGFKIRQKYQMGGGLTIIQDEIGPLQSLNAKAAISYHHRIGQGALAIGLDLGVFNQSISADWRTSGGASGLNFTGTDDPSIPNSEAGSTSFDLGGGLYYYTKEMYVGLSSTHLNQPEISDDPDETSSFAYQQVRHYYVMAGYYYQLNSMFELQPSIFAKTDGVSTQLDINTNVLFNDLVWAGLSYRVEDAAAFLTGVQLGVVPKFQGTWAEPLKIGVAYDYNLSELSDYNDGSMEFMINYCYKIQQQIKLERYKSVRFL
jgi:type IX secretion system PorP/SprF family membrane protein